MFVIAMLAIFTLCFQEHGAVRKRVLQDFSPLLGGKVELLATGGAHTPPHIFPFVREYDDSLNLFFYLR